MNLRSLTSAIAVSSILPLIAWSQSSGQTSGSRSDQQRSNASSSSQQSAGATRDRAPAPDPSAATPSTPASAEPWSTSAASTTITAVGGIQRITPDQMKQRVTASSLVGKEIVDRDGKTLGTIKEIGLTGVLPLHLQSTADPQADKRTPASGIRAPEDRDAVTTRAESNPLSGANPMQPGGTQEVNVFVAVSGEMGTEEDLVVIPASQLWRDEGNKDRYRIALSEVELKTLASPNRPSTSAAE